MKHPKSKPTDAQHTIAFVLQGGGALGAYQAGACEALAIHARQPDWVAGISIGAINAALIAGNPPEQRIERLRAFWERVSSQLPSLPWAPPSAQTRPWLHEWSAAWGAVFGLPGFFRPRPGAAVWPGPMANPSFYDTGPLRDTLLELVDFDRLNDGPMRISVGAVDAAVAVADLNPQAAEAAAAELRGLGAHAMAVGVDVTDEAAVDAAVARTVAELGGLDILVSNADIQIVAPLVDLSFADWKKLLAVHLDGAFLTSRAAMRQMIASGPRRLDDLHGLGAFERGLGAEGTLRDSQARA